MESEPEPDYPRWSCKRIEETRWELLMNGYLTGEDESTCSGPFANSPGKLHAGVDQHPLESNQNGVCYVLPKE